jgi:hypothetical protein
MTFVFENPSSGSQAILCGRTDMTKVRVAFLSYNKNVKFTFHHLRMHLTTAAVEMEDEEQEWWQDRIQINGHKQNKVRRKTTYLQ